MKLKRGYKQTEVGAIPSDWEASTPGRYGRTYGGLTGKSKHDFGRGSALYVTFLDIMENVVIDGTSFEPVDVGVGESQNAVQRGDVLFTGSSETAEEVAMCALVIVERQRLYLNSFCFGYRIDCHDDLDGLFLTYLMRGPVGRRAIASLAQGSTRYNISKRALLQAPLPRPLVHEQRAIAAALSDVDALLDGLNRLIAKKRDLKQATMHQLLTGEMNLPGFSGEWERKRLGEIGHFLKGSGVKRDDSQSGTLACVRYGEIYTTHHDYVRTFHSRISSEVAATATRLEYGDLLFAGSGETKEEIGKCVAFVTETEAYAGGDIVILRPRNVDSLFFGYALNMPAATRQKASFGQGDAVVHISATALAEVSVAVPSIEQQTAIATVLSDIDGEISALEARRNKTRDLKQAMMQELLTGKTRLVQPEVAHA